MGNEQSKQYVKLHRALPPVEQKSTCSDPKPAQLFANEQDREQFIYGTLTTLSQNGALKLESHDFRLLYSRREDERIVARIVAEKEGVVKAQIEPQASGKDQTEAFAALRRHVELSLHRILKDVPGAASMEASSSSARETSTAIVDAEEPQQQTGAKAGAGIVTAGVEAPPAYGKAVKDWQAPAGDKKS